MQNKFQERIQIEFTPELKRNLKQLAKKYHHIRTDLEPVIGELQKGNLIGDRVPSIGYPIFKVRVKNSDIQKGKRAGYRLIYYLKAKLNIILVTIYSKLDQSDISAREIKDIISEVHPD